jgi:FtsZ-binding cell division protein ZapB
VPAICTILQSKDGIMQLNKFERLEERIIQAMDLINHLKQENEEISSSYKKLTDEIQSFETVARSSVADVEKFKGELSTKEMDFIHKKEEIKKRVERLLERLVPLGDLDDGGPVSEESQ